VLDGLLANAPLGATVTLNVQDKAEGQVMQVPLASLYDAGKGPGVWRISAQPAKVAWQPVKVLSVGEEAAQVTGGVKPGEKIRRPSSARGRGRQAWQATQCCPAENKP
jgi:hypothetical protein